MDRARLCDSHPSRRVYFIDARRFRPLNQRTLYTPGTFLYSCHTRSPWRFFLTFFETIHGGLLSLRR